MKKTNVNSRPNPNRFATHRLTDQEAELFRRVEIPAEMNSDPQEEHEPDTSIYLRTKPKGRRARIPEKIRGSHVRKVRYRGSTGYIGEVPMTRLNRKMVAGEGLLELDYLVVLDDEGHDLIDVTAQPFVLRMPPPDTSWTPDFLVTRVGGVQQLTEVKALGRFREGQKRKLGEQELHRIAEMNRKLKVYPLVAAAAGYSYKLATEDEIRIEPKLTNARLVMRHMSEFADEDAPSPICLSSIGRALNTSIPYSTASVPPTSGRSGRSRHTEHFGSDFCAGSFPEEIFVH